MNLAILISDTNSFTGMFQNMGGEAFGGDWILLGIVLIGIIALALMKGNVRSGGAMAVGVGLVFILSIFNPMFVFLFWLAFVASIFMLINGLRRQNQN